MRPDFKALAELFAKEGLADVRDADGVAGIQAARREEASRMVAGWIADRRAPTSVPWAILDFEDTDAFEELATIVRLPGSLDQQDLGHCGPAAILVILFTYFPNLMARFAKELILTGAGRLGSLYIEAPGPMRAVTREDLRSVAPSKPEREPLLPTPLTWMMLVAVLFAMTNNADDVDGLGDGSLLSQVEPLLTSTGLATDFVVESSFGFNLDHPLLVTKKDHSLREILLGCNGGFLDGSSDVPTAIFGNHVIWLKNYDHVPPLVNVDYYTWGSMANRSYRSSIFKSSATDFVSFTIDIGAAS